MEVLLGVAGFLAMVVLGILTLRQGRPGQKLAGRQLEEHERAAIKSLQIAVNGSDADHLVWVLPWREDLIYMLDLDIQVANPSEATVEDVFVVLELSSLIYPADFPRKGDNTARLFKMEQVADPIAGTKRTRVTYRAEAIHPHVGMSFNDFMFLHEPSRVASASPVETKDGKRGKVHWEAVIGYELIVSVMARNIPAIRRSVALYSFDLGDPLVAAIFAPKTAFSKLARGIRASSRAESATLLVVKKPEEPAKDIPPGVDRNVARARLSQAQRFEGCHFSEVGYLPLRPS